MLNFWPEDQERAPCSAGGWHEKGTEGGASHDEENLFDEAVNKGKKEKKKKKKEKSFAQRL